MNGFNAGAESGGRAEKPADRRTGWESDDEKKRPEYLSDMPPKRRQEIYQTSAEMTRDIPGAMICGGNANRLLYEAYTGKPMYGVGKNDSDIYVPSNSFRELLEEQPEGYTLRHELDKHGDEKWIRPSEGYVQLVGPHAHIDVFGVDDSHSFVEIESDEGAIRVQSLADQIHDKVDMMFSTDALRDIPVDPEHNPDPVSKYGLYAQKILEMADTQMGRVDLAEHKSSLPEDWRQTMEVMASMGDYGAPVIKETKSHFLDQLKKFNRQKGALDRAKGELMDSLRAYYEAKRSGEDGSLPSVFDDLAGAKSVAVKAANESETADDFIRVMIRDVSSEEKKEVKKRLEKRTAASLALGAIAVG